MVSKKQQKIDAFKRREAFKEQRKSILIVCEGSKTEPIYFNLLKNELRLTMTIVDVAGIGAEPITVVDRAIKLKEERKHIAKKSLTKTDYDVIYCAIDVEVPQQHTTLAKAIDKAKAHGLKVILSNPCFEYWYILHFIKTSRSFQSNSEVVSLLKKHCVNYNKSNGAIFGVIFDKTSEAIKHSKEVIKEHHNNASDLQNCNPSTNVHLIVEKLQNEKL